MTFPLIVATFIAVVALVWAEWKGSVLRILSKPVASAGFIGVGLSLEPFGSPYGRWIIAGLTLGAIGDIALLGKAESLFLGGLGAFLAGHLAYLIALAPDASPSALWIAIPSATAFTALSLRWLMPGVSGPMRYPVIAYSLVIGGMLAVALGASSVRPIAAAGAVMFAVSDLAVASDRFVTPGGKAFAWGLPLYYTGQIFIALSTGT